MHHFLEGYSSAGDRVSLAIAEHDFDAIASAMTRLLHAAGAEDKYDMLLENYEELEGELDAIVRRSALFSRHAWADQVADLHRLNRRLCNLMSTCRMYFDQVDQDLCSVFGKTSGERQGYTAVRNRQYEHRRGFRILEALRNYAQHRDIPLHGLARSASWREVDGRRVSVRSTQATVDLTRLRSEGGFKADVLAELEGDTLELKVPLREYLTGVQAIHGSVRAMWKAMEVSSLAIITEATARLSAEHAVEAKPTDIVARNANGVIAERRAIFDEFRTRLDALRMKNPTHRDHSKSIRSSE